MEKYLLDAPRNSSNYTLDKSNVFDAPNNLSYENFIHTEATDDEKLTNGDTSLM